MSALFFSDQKWKMRRCSKPLVRQVSCTELTTNSPAKENTIRLMGISHRKLANFKMKKDWLCSKEEVVRLGNNDLHTADTHNSQIREETRGSWFRTTCLQEEDPGYHPPDGNSLNQTEPAWWQRPIPVWHQVPVYPTTCIHSKSQNIGTFKNHKKFQKAGKQLWWRAANGQMVLLWIPLVIG